MIEILKKLPGTNCKECGENTCIAFALKVKNGQLKMSGCPYVTGENDEPLNRKPTVTMDDNYSRVSDELEGIAKQTNFKEAADAIEGQFENRNGDEIIKLKLMNKPYEMRKDGLFMDNKYCHDSWTKIIIYDYVRRKGNVPLAGDWVMLGNFSNTASHVKAFQRKAEEKVAEKFSNDMEGLKARCGELEGKEVEGKIKADYVCRFNLLPRIPLHLCFWDADEEFQAGCKLYVDSSADAYIDIEYLAYLVEKFVEVFVE